MAQRLRATARALVIVAGAMVVGCSDPPPPAAPLDDQAQDACDLFEPIAGDIRRGALDGPQLYRALQDVWNAASQSANDDVRGSAQRALTAAIQDDRQALSSALTELQQACGLPFR